MRINNRVINRTHVRSISKRHENGLVLVTVNFVDGESEHVAVDGHHAEGLSLAIEALGVAPAAPGWSVLRYLPSMGGDDSEVEENSVICWVVDDGGGFEPIWRGSNERFRWEAIKDPNGMVFDCLGDYYASVQAWKISMDEEEAHKAMLAKTGEANE